MPEVKMDAEKFLNEWLPSLPGADVKNEFIVSLDALLQSERDKTREECAKIAEDTPTNVLFAQSHQGFRGAIAQAIRKGGAR